MFLWIYFFEVATTAGVLRISKADLKMLIDNAAVLRHGIHPNLFCRKL